MPEDIYADTQPTPLRDASPKYPSRFPDGLQKAYGSKHQDTGRNSRNRHSSCYRPHKEVEAQGSLCANGKIVQLIRVQDPRKDRHFTADHPVRNTHENEVSEAPKIQDLWFSTTIIYTHNGVLRRALGRFHCTRRRPNSDNTKIL